MDRLGAEVSAPGFTVLHSRRGLAAFSHGCSTREGPASKLPQVVGRIHFMMAVELIEKMEGERERASSSELELRKTCVLS